jgi:hypothetical protein
VTASLPPAPSLEQLRKQAKDLLRAVRAGDPDALARVAASGPRPGEPLRLSGAQLVVAREHGFPSWPRLARTSGGSPRTAPGCSTRSTRTRATTRSARTGCSRPRRTGREAPRRCSPAGTRRSRARVRAKSSPASTGSRAGRRCAATSAACAESGEPFARAYRAVEAHDLDGLRALLDRFPELTRRAARTATTCSAWPPPPATAGSSRCCWSAGRTRERERPRLDAAAPGRLHGPPALARRLLDAGAPVDVSARGDGGTPLVVALFWGTGTPPSCSPRAAPCPRTCAWPRGWATWPDRGAHVGPCVPRRAPTASFYRPHGGFPAWRPADDPAGGARRGARLGRPQRSRGRAGGSRARRRARRRRRLPRHPLAWAAFAGRASAIRRLLALGADPDGARASAARTTARASRRCTSPPRAGGSRRSRRCSRAAPIRRCATGSTEGRPPTGRSTAGRRRRRGGCARGRLGQPVGFRRPARRYVDSWQTNGPREADEWRPRKRARSSSRRACASAT